MNFNVCSLEAFCPCAHDRFASLVSLLLDHERVFEIRRPTAGPTESRAGAFSEEYEYECSFSRSWLQLELELPTPSAPRQGAYAQHESQPQPSTKDGSRPLTTVQRPANCKHNAIAAIGHEPLDSNFQNLTSAVLTRNCAGCPSVVSRTQRGPIENKRHPDTPARVALTPAHAQGGRSVVRPYVTCTTQSPPLSSGRGKSASANVAHAAVRRIVFHPSSHIAGLDAKVSVSAHHAPGPWVHGPLLAVVPFTDIVGVESSHGSRYVPPLLTVAHESLTLTPRLDSSRLVHPGYSHSNLCNKGAIPILAASQPSRRSGM